jgi:hypothetical protein
MSDRVRLHEVIEDDFGITTKNGQIIHSCTYSFGENGRQPMVFQLHSHPVPITMGFRLQQEGTKVIFHDMDQQVR